MFINPPTITIFVILQIIGKTLSASLLGFILAVIFLKTHNLFIIAIVHTINDLGLFIPFFLFEQQGLTNYVSSNSTQGMVISIGYIVQFLIIFPAAIYAYKQLKTVSIPQWRFFNEPWNPITVKKH